MFCGCQHHLTLVRKSDAIFLLTLSRSSHLTQSNFGSKIEHVISPYLDALVAAKAIQLVQKFEHSALDLAIAAKLGVEPLRPDGVHLVNEDDARGLQCRQYKRVSSDV
jgi:hypothetical protein